jgi:uncharacterized surface protein with fasciclin (FAS1) repeats
LLNDMEILLDVSRDSGTLVIETARVTEPDLEAYNGVVHGLDRVLPLPESIPAVVQAQPFPLSAAGNFTILTALIQASVPFNKTLATGGSFTLLAPTGRSRQSSAGASSLNN